MFGFQSLRSFFAVGEMVGGVDEAPRLGFGGRAAFGSFIAFVAITIHDFPICTVREAQVLPLKEAPLI